MRKFNDEALLLRYSTIKEEKAYNHGEEHNKLHALTSKFVLWHGNTAWLKSELIEKPALNAFELAIIFSVKSQANNCKNVGLQQQPLMKDYCRPNEMTKLDVKRRKYRLPAQGDASKIWGSHKEAAVKRIDEQADTKPFYRRPNFMEKRDFGMRQLSIMPKASTEHAL